MKVKYQNSGDDGRKDTAKNKKKRKSVKMEKVKDDGRTDTTKNKKKKGGKNWIAAATKNRGGLHKSLGVPAGSKIPTKKLNAAASSKNPKIARQANLAKTLAGLRKKRKKDYPSRPIGY